MYTLYKLVDPRDNKTRYIGYTGNLLYKRLASHIYDSRKYNKCYRHHWINKLASENLTPTIKELCKVKTLEQAHTLEIELIKHYSRFCKLTNNTSGGEGSKGYKQSKELIERIKNTIKSLNLKPYTRTDKHRKQISERKRLSIRGINLTTGEERTFKDKDEAMSIIKCSYPGLAQVSCGLRNSVNNWVVEFIKK